MIFDIVTDNTFLAALGALIVVNAIISWLIKR